MTFGEHFRKGLEDRRAVGRRQGLAILDRRLQHSRPGFGMEAFERHVHFRAELDQGAVEVVVDRGAQHRIAEPARREALEVAVALLAHAMRRLVEDEKLELRGDIGGETHFAARSITRRNIRRGQIAAAGPSNSPRKNSMSPSRGTSRQVLGSISAVASGKAVCQPVKVELS